MFKLFSFILFWRRWKGGGPWWSFLCSLFAKSLLEEGRNELCREIFLLEYENEKSSWIKTLKKYMREVSLTLGDIRGMKKNTIVDNIKRWDSQTWTAEIQHKTTLTLYAKFKKDVMEESWIDNTEGSKLLIKARTNTLALNWRNRLQNKTEECPCCGHETESLQHFLLECPEFNTIRNNTLFLEHLQHPHIDNETKLGNILALTPLNIQQIEDRKIFVKRLWDKRTKKIKTLQVV